MSPLDLRILREPIDSPVWGGRAATSTAATHDAQGADLPGPATTIAPATVVAEHAASPRPLVRSIVVGASTMPGDLDDDELGKLLRRSPRELNERGEQPILRARCDDVARRIIRDGGQVSMAGLAREVGSCAATIKRLLATPLFRKVFSEVNDELMGTIDERIGDERLDVVLRQKSMQARAMTVLGEMFEIVRKHRRDVEGGSIARPGLLKLGIEAAAEVRQLGSAIGATGGTGGGATVNINVTRNQATIIQGAIREAGVDLSDVVGDLFPSTPTTDDDHQEKGAA